MNTSTRRLPERISIGKALSSAPLQHTFVLPGLRPGTVGALIGPGGSGKTTLAIQIAVALALGRPIASGLFPAATKPFRVAMFSAEDPEDVFVERIRNIVCDEIACDGQFDLLTHQKTVDDLEGRLHIYSLAGRDMRIVRRQQSADLLNEIAAATHGFDLIILETVSRLHDGDENAATDMAALVTAAERLAQSTGAAVLLIHHSSKAADVNSRGDSQHAARGSSAFVDNVRWVANLFTLSEDQAQSLGITRTRRAYARFELTKANYIAPLPPTLLRRHEGGVLKRDELCASTPAPRTLARSAT